MKFKRSISLLVLFLFVISLTNTFAQTILVKDILNNPSKYDGELVEVTGLVIQYVEATERTTAHYLLKDDYGAVIRINTAEGEPETNTKYNATGILYVDKMTNEPFISEKSRVKIPGDQPANVIIQQKTWLEENILLVIFIGSAIILILLIIIFVNRKSSGSSGKEKTYVHKERNPDQEPQPTPREDLKTMVVPKVSQKTMKFIPGEFQVLSGQDKGKNLKIAGYPTSEGSVVTIGREKVTGPRDYAHIELKEKTISRKQAEIISRDHSLYIKNLSETNFTQLDDEDIPVNQMKELKSGSVIGLGEVEIKYKN